MRASVAPVERLTGIQEVIGSNPAGGMIFFFFQYFLKHYFATKILAHCFRHSKHVSMQDFSEITCPLSGNSNNIAANRYVVLFYFLQCVEGTVVRKTH